jgi:acetoin utilization deacetylase AcuC-like enzyme
MRVYFTEKMTAKEQSCSPSAAKPTKVAKDWLQAFGDQIEIVRPGPASELDICMAHDPKYVKGVLTGNQSNGFGSFDESVIASLPYTSGAMISAAKYAAKSGEPAAALCSGFHHAAYDGGGGFCTFNGLMIAALHLKDKGIVKNVGILDLDMHYGDGTDNIIQELGIKWVKHFTAGLNFCRKGDARSFLKKLSSIIKHTFKNCDVLLVQLGADPYIDDPLGGWLTIKQLAERDKIVFETAKEMGIPVAWNLAGGYSRDKSGEITPVLEIHRNSAQNCITVYAEVKAA